MQQLTTHMKKAFFKDLYFNHHYMANASQALGEMGHKDTELIQMQF